MLQATALVFAKYPEPGTVNTRMIPGPTAEEAAQLHRASLRAVCERASGVDGINVELAVTPDERAEEMHDVCRAWITGCFGQGDGDLGARLIRGVRRTFDRGASGVLLLGADSPTMPVEHLHEALRGLETHEVALGSCEDGGYCLLGLNGPVPALFDRIDWGGPHVARQTRERAAQAGIDLIELPTWYDLDRFEELSRALDDLAEATQPAAVALQELIQSYIER